MFFIIFSSLLFLIMTEKYRVQRQILINKLKVWELVGKVLSIRHFRIFSPDNLRIKSFQIDYHISIRKRGH